MVAAPVVRFSGLVETLCNRKEEFLKRFGLDALAAFGERLLGVLSLNIVLRFEKSIDTGLLTGFSPFNDCENIVSKAHLAIPRKIHLSFCGSADVVVTEDNVVDITNNFKINNGGSHRFHLKNKNTS